MAAAIRISPGTIVGAPVTAAVFASMGRTGRRGITTATAADTATATATPSPTPVPTAGTPITNRNPDRQNNSNTKSQPGRGRTKADPDPSKKNGRAKPSTARPRPTHFLSIPLTAPRPCADITNDDSVSQHRTRSQSQSQSRSALYAALKSHLWSHPTIRALPRSALQPFHSLHLTLGVMHLPTEGAVAEAVQLLRQIDLARILDRVDREGAENEGRPCPTASTLASPSPPPLALTLESLDTFRSPAHAVSVLYLRPERGTSQTERLRRFCDAVRAEFVARGLILKQGGDSTTGKRGKGSEGEAGAEGERERAAEEEKKKKEEEKGEEGGERKGGKRERHHPQKGDFVLHATVVKMKRDPRRRHAPGPSPRTSGGANTAVTNSEKTDQTGTGTEAATATATATATRAEDGHTDPSRPPRRNRNPRFDARAVMHRCRSVTWVSDFPLDRVAICEMGARAVRVGELEGGTADGEFGSESESEDEDEDESGTAIEGEGGVSLSEKQGRKAHGRGGPGEPKTVTVYREVGFVDLPR